MLRKCIGEAGTLMFDANHRWSLPVAIRMCRELMEFQPLWIEEPTHPDDLHGHALLAREITPVKIAAGEHIPNRIVFKNFFESGALYYVQADCTRLAGGGGIFPPRPLSEKNSPPILPPVVEMGQIYPHPLPFSH